ncbi:hypothetical protein Sta7437_4759 (plasmid) [Stanieria cyanosphaera PCC 7437]|uniref:PepSY domain-containing protein n=1 Tax=Stanieria cyanosphaera (strain ATCC 29371 / PCC 7437) TaxID=111780 RepID=K9Y2G2_STAC7|nr:hypothetical protein [Stanieria cyanosphaera]AFZ38197.1 hypothetical protein Sta7437_4759 [Stanieria cyanosphaera PCC 7437]
MAINKARLRHIHFWFAPIMFFPILLTSITGSLFQVAVITGKGEQFLWLLDFHRGKFGRINLEFIYPLLNAFGVLMLVVTGIIMWLQIRQKVRRRH